MKSDFSCEVFCCIPHKSKKAFQVAKMTWINSNVPAWPFFRMLLELKIQTIPLINRRQMTKKVLVLFHTHILTNVSTNGMEKLSDGRVGMTSVLLHLGGTLLQMSQAFNWLPWLPGQKQRSPLCTTGSSLFSDTDSPYMLH